MKFLKQNINKILVLVIYILMFYVVSEWFFKVFDNFADLSDKVFLYTVTINTIIYVVVIVSCLLLLKKELKTDFKILSNTSAMKVFWVCIIGLVAGYLGNFIGSRIVQALDGADSSLNQSAIETLMFSKYGFIMIILTVFIGPITEELVFRKAMHNFFRNLKFPAWLILIISSVIFGFIHVLDEGDFVQVFPYIFMGAALGGIELYSKNIYPSMIVHIIINAIATSMIFFSGIMGIM